VALRHAILSKRPNLPTDAVSVLGWKDTTDRLYEMLSDSGHGQWLMPWSPSAARPESDRP
jgi:hypothetical protein